MVIRVALGSCSILTTRGGGGGGTGRGAMSVPGLINDALVYKHWLVAGEILSTGETTCPIWDSVVGGIRGRTSQRSAHPREPHPTYYPICSPPPLTTLHPPFSNHPLSQIHFFHTTLPLPLISSNYFSSPPAPSPPLLQFPWIAKD